jgi:hypothetical protein
MLRFDPFSDGCTERGWGFNAALDERIAGRRTTPATAINRS